VNDPGTPPPDWESIFYQARRRMLGRLLAVGAIAGVGTALLLSGGLTAQGAATIPIPGIATKSEKTKAKEVKKTHKQKHRKKERQQAHKKHKAHQTHPGNGQHHHPKHCTEKPQNSAEEEYGRWEWPNGAAGHKCPTKGTG
jgi:hypothetical protein